MQIQPPKLRYVSSGGSVLSGRLMMKKMGAEEGADTVSWRALRQ
jgi:hypothetical protein